MASIQPQNRPETRLGLLLPGSSSSPNSPGVERAGELFRQEVDRAVDRRGGRRALAERREELASERHAERGEGFRRHDEAVARRERAARRARDGETDVDRAPVGEGIRQPRETHGGRSRVEDSGRGVVRDHERRTEVRHTGADAGVREGSGGAAAESGAAGLASASGTAAGVVTGASSGTSTGVQATASTSTTRPASPLEAFQAGAGLRDGTKAPELPGASKSTPASPKGTPEAIEHAAEVLRQIRLSLHGGAKEVRVQLTPESLGRIHIRLRSEEQSLRAVVRVEDPKTLRLLEHQAPELKAVLAQQGFDADKISLELGLSGDAQFGAQDSSSRFGRELSRSVGVRAPEGASEPIPTPHAGSVAPRSGRLDTYA